VAVQTPSNGIIEIFKPISFTYSLKSAPGPVNYTFNYGDGAGTTAMNVSGMESKTFALPGEQLVTVTVQDALLSVSVKILIDFAH
jgi:hypothetical protein